MEGYAQGSHTRVVQHLQLCASRDIPTAVPCSAQSWRQLSHSSQLVQLGAELAEAGRSQEYWKLQSLMESMCSISANLSCCFHEHSKLIYKDVRC